SMDADGSTVIKAAQIANGDPVILFSPEWGTNEYYMLEYRTGIRPKGAGYDVDVADATRTGYSRAGLVIWHIKTHGVIGEDLAQNLDTIESSESQGATMNSVFMNGAPNFSRASGAIWSPNTTIPYVLSWLDSTPQIRQVKIRVGNIIEDGDAL